MPTHSPDVKKNIYKLNYAYIDFEIFKNINATPGYEKCIYVYVYQNKYNIA